MDPRFQRLWLQSLPARHLPSRPVGRLQGFVVYQQNIGAQHWQDCGGGQRQADGWLQTKGWVLAVHQMGEEGLIQVHPKGIRHIVQGCGFVVVFGVYSSVNKQWLYFFASHRTCALSHIFAAATLCEYMYSIWGFLSVNFSLASAQHAHPEFCLQSLR